MAHFVWMIAWGWRIHMREMFLIIFQTPCLEWRFFSSTLVVDWREVMSWYTVDGSAYIVIDAEQQGSWSSSVIARGSVQSEPWDLGYYWPWWQWDPGEIGRASCRERVSSPV